MIRLAPERSLHGLLLASVLVAGCGGGEAAQPAAAPTPATAPATGPSLVPVATTAPTATAAAASVPGDPPPAGAGKAAGAGETPVPLPVPIPGSEYVRGRSTAIVRAPIQRVREAVNDFVHYAEFMPHYRSCKVLGRTSSGARDVYMEVEALHGVVKMWAEIEMPTRPAVSADGIESFETRFVKGNVKDFSASWRLRKVDDETTELTLEVFLDPGIPLPQGIVNKENLGGSSDGVVAMRAHAEQMKK
jgi:ribosome-associated toxin RatA of RatAB toxin-antitoxin module